MRVWAGLRLSLKLPHWNVYLAWKENWSDQLSWQHICALVISSRIYMLTSARLSDMALLTTLSITYFSPKTFPAWDLFTNYTPRANQNSSTSLKNPFPWPRDNAIDPWKIWLLIKGQNSWTHHSYHIVKRMVFFCMTQKLTHQKTMDQQSAPTQQLTIKQVKCFENQTGPGTFVMNLSNQS